MSKNFYITIAYTITYLVLGNLNKKILYNIQNRF